MLERGFTVADVAARIGIPKHTLYDWVQKAKKAETYARELFYARVAATGRLADADDLTFDEALLDDHDALLGAVEELVARKPHLASRKIRGDVGQGLSGGSSSVDLAGILRSRA